jgi:hypothetical protein
LLFFRLKELVDFLDLPHNLILLRFWWYRDFDSMNLGQIYLLCSVGSFCRSSQEEIRVPPQPMSEISCAQSKARSHCLNVLVKRELPDAQNYREGVSQDHPAHHDEGGFRRHDLRTCTRRVSS